MQKEWTPDHIHDLISEQLDELDIETLAYAMLDNVGIKKKGFDLSFSIDNDVFQDGGHTLEAERILNTVAGEVAHGKGAGIIRDSNGNTIGSWSRQIEDEAEEEKKEFLVTFLLPFYQTVEVKADSPEEARGQARNNINPDQWEPAQSQEPDFVQIDEI